MCGLATSDYAAFINQVQAQTGKAITPAAAAILIADAQYLEAHLPVNQLGAQALGPAFRSTLGSCGIVIGSGSAAVFLRRTCDGATLSNLLRFRQGWQGYDTNYDTARSRFVASQIREHNDGSGRTLLDGFTGKRAATTSASSRRHARGRLSLACLNLW